MRCLSSAVVLLLAGAAGAEEPKTVRVELAASAFDFALNPDTGGLAVVVPDDDRVLLYPKFAATHGATPPVSASVGRMPLAIAFKRFGEKSYFLVACRDSAEVAVLDAATLKLVKAIPVKGGGPTAVVSSANPKDKFAFYTAASRWPGAGVSVVTGRIDLESLTDAGRAPDPLADQSEFVPSADGTLVHFRHRGQVNGLQHYQTHRLPDPSAAGWQDVVTVPEGKADGPGLLADPRGKFVAAGVLVCDLATGKELARLPFAPLLASPSRPLLFGLKDDRVAAVSTNSFAVVGAAALPAKKDDLRDGRRLGIADDTAATPPVYRPRVFEDRTANAVLVCQGKTVFVVPDTALDLPGEPFLGLGVGSRLEFVVGRRTDIPLRPEGGAAELVSGPNGLRVADGTLSWSPGPDALGSHEVVIRVTSGNAARTEKRRALVRHGAVELPLRPMPLGPNGRMFSLAPDGSSAVVVGYGRDPRQPHAVAVLDLVGEKVTATRALPTRPTAAAIDGRFVYVGQDGSNDLLVLSANDLTEVRRVDLGGRVDCITPVAGKYAAFTGDSRTTTLSVPDFRPAMPPGHVASAAPKDAKGKPEQEHAAWSNIPPVWVGDGWWHRGVIFDATLSKPRAAIDPRDFWSPAPSARPVDQGHMDDDPPDYRERPNASRERWYTPWGVTIEKRELKLSGQSAGRIPPGAPHDDRRPLAAVVLPDRPAIAVLVVERGRTPDGESVARVEVVFVDPANQPLARVPLANGPETDIAGTPGPVSLDFRGGKLVALVGRHVYVAPVPADAARGRALLRFAPDYPTTVVPATGRSRFAAPAVAGAEGRAVILLHDGTDGLRYDAPTGELVFDPEALVARVSRELAERAKNGGVEDYLRRTAAAFEVVTGKKPRHVPVWVPFGLAATNNGRRAEGRFGFFVEIPKEEFRARPTPAPPPAPAGDASDPPASIPSDAVPRKGLYVSGWHGRLARPCATISRVVWERREAVHRIAAAPLRVRKPTGRGHAECGRVTSTPTSTRAAASRAAWNG